MIRAGEYVDTVTHGRCKITYVSEYEVMVIKNGVHDRVHKGDIRCTH